MQVDEFCLFLKYDNDQLIREIAETFKKDIDAGNIEETDDSIEITTISASSALKDLLVRKKYSNETAINQYFNELNNILIYLSILLFSLCYTNNHFL
jgi:GGDEF domain-containing protein